MLISIELRKFRKHIDLLIDFAAGLNVIRGSNEAGKSTLLEGVLYALYGSKALRDTLDETVTWSHKVSELFAKLVIRIGGVDYTFTRSKAGAECTWNGGKVVGQNEVSNYATELLGADVKVASLLMLASQSGLRGALDDGPAAVSALMGKLANFDMIDQIVEAASTKLALGSAVPLQAKLDDARLSLEAAQARIPDPEQLANQEAKVVETTAQVEALVKLEAEVLQPAMMAADYALTTGREANQARRDAAEVLKRAEERCALEQGRLNHANEDASRKPDPAAVEAARLALQRATTNQGHINAHRQFLALPKYPASYWDKPKVDFDAELAKLDSELTAAYQVVAGYEAEIKVLKRSYITNGRCPTCGAVSMTDEHVKAKNEEIDAQIKVLELKAVEVVAPVKDHRATITAMRDIAMVAASRDREWAKIHSYVEVDESQYPSIVTWKGDVPGAVDIKPLQAQLRELEDQSAKATQAQGRVDALKQTVADAETARSKAAAHLATLKSVDIEPLEVALKQAADAYDASAHTIRAARADLAVQIQANLQLAADSEAAAHAVSVAKSRIDEYQIDIKRLEFNNALVGKLKRLKPMITDHLWGTVLAAVSNFFSNLRGEQSVVTKDAGGFKVNGQSIESLSGSTLDVLALAIRVALSKTFVPHASFLVLDEPAHGCDSSRTGNVLGFLSSVGFTQTILASHDELSEAVADHVIALSA